MPALADVRLATPRLVLRELALEDAAAVQEWAADPEVARYMPWGPNTPEQTEAFLRDTVPTRWETPRRTFELGIALRASGRLVGACGIRIRSPEDRVADMGYALRRDAWGQGLATEAARALVEFGFRTLGMHRIWATCHVDNARSARVLEKAGMRREGRLRENVLKNGVWRDSWLYAVVEGDAGVTPVLVRVS
ncbi:MAG TPA: GNAT family N-acetyltransferase [Anaeromyxobacter sp.]|nr:GNAT family N-acetyltransferase [Anaeromyxobacter sp.]